MYTLRYGSGFTKKLLLRSYYGIYRNYFAIFSCIICVVAPDPAKQFVNWNWSKNGEIIYINPYLCYGFGAIMGYIEIISPFSDPFWYTNYFATFGLISHLEQGHSDENRSDQNIIWTNFVFGAISFGDQGIWRKVVRKKGIWRYGVRRFDSVPKFCQNFINIFLYYAIGSGKIIPDP
jgi:hypothetical protein